MCSHTVIKLITVTLQNLFIFTICTNQRRYYIRTSIQHSNNFKYIILKKSGLKISFHVFDKSKFKVYRVTVYFTAKTMESEITQQHKKK